jgi:hypothetical protein
VETEAAIIMRWNLQIVQRYIEMEPRKSYLLALKREAEKGKETPKQSRNPTDKPKEACSLKRNCNLKEDSSC